MNNSDTTNNQCAQLGALQFLAFAAILLLLPGSALAQLSTANSQLFRQGQDMVPGAGAADEEFGGVIATGDFDGDGFLDLAIGTPRENVAPVTEAGTVTVIYGSSSGLSAAFHQLLDLNGPAGQVAGSDDHFGAALASGDFDDDGDDDLAVGVPGRDVAQPMGGAMTGAGAVVVFYGSPGGLMEAGAQYWRQAFDGVQGASEAGDAFGTALATGDFDGNGYADLAIGVPREDVGAIADAGAINVIFGSGGGLWAGAGVTPDQIWTQGDLGTNDEANDRFGTVLTAADWNADGPDDLAIGTPTEDWTGVSDSGVVFVMSGTATGLTAVGDVTLAQNSSGVPFDVEMNDDFGRGLAAGDFNGDGVADLAVGVPGKNLFRGIVHLFPGVPGAGLSSTVIATHFGGTITGDQPGDRFGSALVAARFSGAADDLAIGVPGASLPGMTQAGRVVVIGGSSLVGPVLGQEVAVFDQSNVAGAEEADDFFGEALAAGDFDGNGMPDLAVGVPGEGVGALDDLGAVDVIYGYNLFSDGFESGTTGAWSAAFP